MAKGGTYEREFSKRLSLWWSHGGRDDIFWRSQNSGGRASSRAKAGKFTSGQFGDIAATDPMGNSLMELVTIELKRGYKSATASHAIARSVNNVRPTEWEDFFLQARAASINGKVPYWMLVVRHDRARDMVFIPHLLFCKLRDHEAFDKRRPRPFMFIEHDVYEKGEFDPIPVKVVCFTLDDFFKLIKRGHFEAIARDRRDRLRKKRRRKG